MVEDPEQVTCRSCDRAVHVETAAKIVVKQDGRQVWTTLCPECAAVVCPNCGTDVPVGKAVASRDSIWETGPSGETVDCTRCGDTVPVADAAEIHRDDDPGYQRTVCGDCLDELGGLPEEYRIADLAEAD